MQLTSIEWLENELIEKKIVRKDNLSTYHDFPTTFELLFMEAKEMHKQEIMDAYVNGQSLGFDDSPKYWAEKYHQETFVSKGSYVNGDIVTKDSVIVELPQQEISDESWEGCDGCTEQDEIMYKNGYVKGYNAAIAELPKEISDEEIEKWAKEYKYYFEGDYQDLALTSFIAGCIWYREQLKCKGNGES